jgi:cytidylate kinase
LRAADDAITFDTTDLSMATMFAAVERFVRDPEVPATDEQGVSA